MLDAGCWVLGAGCWMLDARCWMLDARCWVLDAGCWVLGVRSSLSSHAYTSCTLRAPPLQALPRVAKKISSRGDGLPGRHSPIAMSHAPRASCLCTWLSHPHFLQAQGPAGCPVPVMLAPAGMPTSQGSVSVHGPPRPPSQRQGATAACFPRPASGRPFPARLAGPIRGPPGNTDTPAAARPARSRSLVPCMRRAARLAFRQGVVRSGTMDMANSARSSTAWRIGALLPRPDPPTTSGTEQEDFLVRCGRGIPRPLRRAHAHLACHAPWLPASCTRPQTRRCHALTWRWRRHGGRSVEGHDQADSQPWPTASRPPTRVRETRRAWPLRRPGNPGGFLHSLLCEPESPHRLVVFASRIQGW